MPCVGLSHCEPRALRRTGFRSRDMWAARGLTSTGSKARVPRLSCPMASGIFSDQGWNPCLLHRQADSLPRSHQGSPVSGLSCSPNLDLRSGICQFPPINNELPNITNVLFCEQVWHGYQNLISGARGGLGCLGLHSCSECGPVGTQRQACKWPVLPNSLRIYLPTV